MDPWQPGTLEDRLIAAYTRDHPGTFFLEVPIGSARMRGGWPPGSITRRIDAIRLVDSHDTYVVGQKNLDVDEFAAQVHGKDVELIEVKKKLNRPVIGQVNAGYDMFAAEYGASSVTPVALCSAGDPALEWVCAQRSIDVHILEPDPHPVPHN